MTRGRWELLDTAPIPGQGGELRLYRWGDEFSIHLPGQGELMSSRTHGSEDALGTLACAPLAGRAGVRLLVGGLGMGFTLAAALARLAPDAQVVVAELVAGVVRWNEGVLGDAAGFPLRDPRVRVREADVCVVLGEAPGCFDAIVLDVDNGPEGFTRRENDRLYSPSGLAAAHRALRAHGTLAVWSTSRAPRFTARLRRAGFSAREHRVRGHRGKGSHHVVWLAQRDDSPRGPTASRR